MKKRFFFPLAAILPLMLTAAPKIDGKLDDPEWAGARKFDRFTVMNSTQPDRSAEVLLLHDAEALYIGCKVSFADGKAPQAKATKRDGRVHADDSMEIMIDPGASPDRYAHIAVNAAGVIADGYCDQGGFVRDGKWDGDIAVKSFIGEDFWSVELKVPYASLELDQVKSDVWSFNFCHNSLNPSRNSSIARGAYHEAGSFVKVPGFQLDHDRCAVRIAPPDFTVRRGDDGNFAVNGTVALVHHGGKPRRAKVDITLTGPDIAAKTVNCELSPGKNETLKLPELLLKKAGDYTAIVSILDPATRRVDIRRKFPVKIDYAPLSIRLDHPHYRNAIFASQNLAEVVYQVGVSGKTGGPLKTGIRDASGKILMEKTLSAPGEVRFPAASIPEGKLEIFAEDGSSCVTHELRKLAPRKGEVWRDEQGFWRIDGKRFFMIGEWVDTHVPGANVSTYKRSGTLMLETALMTSKSPARKNAVKNTISDAAETAIRKLIRQKRDSDLFAWYLTDEPEVWGISVAGLNAVARIARDEDCYHPLVVSNDTVGGMYDFADAAEINGLHPYPAPRKGKPRSGFGRIVAFMDAARNFNAGRRRPQTIFYLQQGFNYGDWGNCDSRIPTFDEIRTQFWMTVIMGGRGILFYNRTTEHYPELRIGMPEVGKEFAALTDVLTSDDQPGGKDSGKVRVLVKKVNGHLWIMAASTDAGECSEEFNYPELGDRTLYVWRENRAVAAKNGRFRDTFRNFDVHIYTTDPDPRGLRPLAEVEAEIDKANEARRKEGNLAFQMQEYDKMRFASSSNFHGRRRADNTLWHVTDGVNLGDRSLRFGNNRTFFKDNTPGRLPDWIELQFPEPVTVGRVAVYPIKESLKDYEIQLFSDGAYRTVGKVQDASGPMQEVRFEPVKTDKVRVFVTANRGPHTMIAEIEVYEK